MHTDLGSKPRRRSREPIEDPPCVVVVRKLGIEPKSIARWSEDQSRVTIVEIMDGLSLVDSRGPGHPESRSFYLAHAPGTCRLPDSVIFWDISGLTSTDLSVVNTCLGVGKANRHNISQVHMFYRSPLVGMAVTVGNVALGGLIQLYRDADPFHAALTEATQARMPA